MVKRLTWSPLAQRQKRTIFKYWNERNRSKSYSRKLNVLFNEAAELLLKYPEIGFATDFGNIRLKLVREYWLAYRVFKEELQILCIWDVRQDHREFKELITSLADE